MQKKFEMNQTKIKVGCQFGRKGATHNSKSDLPLVFSMYVSTKYAIYQIGKNTNSFSDALTDCNKMCS